MKTHFTHLKSFDHVRNFMTGRWSWIHETRSFSMPSRFGLPYIYVRKHTIIVFVLSNISCHIFCVSCQPFVILTILFLNFYSYSLIQWGPMLFWWVEAAGIPSQNRGTWYEVFQSVRVYVFCFVKRCGWRFCQVHRVACTDRLGVDGHTRRLQV